MRQHTRKGRVTQRGVVCPVFPPVGRGSLRDRGGALSGKHLRIKLADQIRVPEITSDKGVQSKIDRPDTRPRFLENGHVEGTSWFIRPELEGIE